jgi:hypothetical protein
MKTKQQQILELTNEISRILKGTPQDPMVIKPGSVFEIKSQHTDKNPHRQFVVTDIEAGYAWGYGRATGTVRFRVSEHDSQSLGSPIREAELMAVLSSDRPFNLQLRTNGFLDYLYDGEPHWSGHIWELGKELKDQANKTINYLHSKIIRK